MSASGYALHSVCTQLSFPYTVYFQGDSGGPLACSLSGTNDWYMVGVVSYGKGCGEKLGIYSSVKYYKPWIRGSI